MLVTLFILIVVFRAVPLFIVLVCMIVVMVVNKVWHYNFVRIVFVFPLTGVQVVVDDPARLHFLVDLQCVDLLQFLLELVLRHLTQFADVVECQVVKQVRQLRLH